MSIRAAISKIVVLLILSVFFTIFGLYFIPESSKFEPITFRTIENAHRSDISSAQYQCCTPLNISLRKHLYFVKTHKTGGSTIQNIILRFSLMHSLDVMTIMYPTYYQPLSDFSIFPHIKTPNNKYHILAHHIRYTDQLRWYQYPNTALVTVLRHPATLFQSLYTYFRFQDTMGMTFQQFLQAPVKPSFLWGITNLLAYRGYNQMSYDLGFNLEQNANNQTAIDEFIQKIDRDFDLVMITEYMEQSLVLLANLMGWPLEYVAHLNINVRPAYLKSYKLTSKDELVLLELNKIDSLLYHHFLQKFKNCAKQYGLDKLNKKVRQLRILNKKLKQRCVAKENVGVLIDGYLLTNEYITRNSSDLECLYATSFQIPLENTVMDEQYKRLLRPENKYRYFI